ncbi:MAG: carboxypeptidase-like regulatory domain-containing protein [Terriglobales bacterium]|jgi:hypothetical protein
MFMLSTAKLGYGQDVNASLSGTVTDPSGAVIPGAKLTLTDEATGFTAKFVSDTAGEYAFHNLPPGKYDLDVSANGFKSTKQNGIELAVNQAARVGVKLPVGKTEEVITVYGETSLINFENQTLEAGISPEALEDIPLVVNGAPRSSIEVATMMPGVTSAGGNNALNARFNGGIATGDEAIVDGVTTEEGFMNQSGMVALQSDFGMSPDITSEVKVLTANYDAQYGNTTSAQLIIQTKSGGEKFHGGGYEYVRNNFFNASQYGTKPGGKATPDKENDYGTYIGGPVYLPGFHGDKSFLKGYFYFNWEGFQDHGGAVSATDTIASGNDRNGNFSGWGSQLYYPNDHAKYGALAGTAIPGNIIPSQYEDPIAKAWMAALPTPTNSNELNNYFIPVSGQGSLTNSENVYFWRADLNVGQKDHFYYTWWWQYSGINTASDLPVALSNAGPASPENAPILRINWEHTFTDSMFNHFSFGYLNRNEGYYQLDKDSTLPKVSGVASIKDMPTMAFNQDGITQLGTTRPANSAEDVTTRGTLGLNDVFTYVRGRHTLKAGFEWKLAGTAIHNGTNEGGQFNFDQATTGNTNSAVCPNGCPGDPLASFYLGAVAQATTNYVNVLAEYPRQYGYAAHFGDEWRITPKLTANLSARWDYVTSFAEKYDNLTFLDPVGTNPGAYNSVTGTYLPGRLAYAGNKWGSASYGAPYPEIPVKSNLAPRVGFAYTINEKTVVRAGYGMYYGTSFYPGWGGGMSQDGFNKTVTVNETPSGFFQIPALYLQNGISAAQTGSTASTINSAFDNGNSGPYYRPLDANKRSYSSQWNLTVEHQLPSNFFVTLSYVGTKGTHLPSLLSPLNVLNPNSPQIQALGAHLNDVFAPGQTKLDGVSIPYDNFVSQMGSCATVQQALVPYPMYCSNLQGDNEKHGTSIYNSFQGKVERHLSQGLYVLGTITVQKMYTDGSDSVQAGGNESGPGFQGNDAMFSPFNEKPKAWALVPDNTPLTYQLTAIYDLPFGYGKQFANSRGVSDAIVGGWKVVPLFHYDYGQPFSFYSSNCTTFAVAPRLREGCVPGVIGGQTVQLHGRNGFNPKSGGTYLNVNAFEPASAFTQFGYTGTGSAETSIYGPSWKNFDMSLAKETKIAEKVTFKFAANFFNFVNNHSLINSTNGNVNNGPEVSFVTDVANPQFGQWNGGVSAPRTIQFSGRLEF